MILCNRRRLWKWLLSSCWCLSLPAFAAGGKIAGNVTDKQSGEPMPGVNVLVEGTTLGAATNLQGEYVILNVPSGKYTLRASFIGYAVTRVENLRVSLDLTTRHDFALAPEALTGEEVVIVAERPLVQKDLTATQQIKTADEIKALPVETFLGVLTTQAGVNTGADGAIHIRGDARGRSQRVHQRAGEQCLESGAGRVESDQRRLQRRIRQRHERHRESANQRRRLAVSRQFLRLYRRLFLQ